MLFPLATRSVQSTPANNTHKRVWQYIEKERKTLILWLQCSTGSTQLEDLQYLYITEKLLARM